MSVYVCLDEEEWEKDEGPRLGRLDGGRKVIRLRSVVP